MIKRGRFRRSGGHFRGAVIFQRLPPKPFLVFDVVSLSVVRKSQAPRPATRPLRHAVCGAASALVADIAPPLVGPCSSDRSLGLVAQLWRLASLPRHSFASAAPFLSCRRSSRALWSPLLASLSSAASSCPPPARHSHATAWLGGVSAQTSCLSAGRNGHPPTPPL